MSVSMLAVLDWLAAHPGVEIAYHQGTSVSAAWTRMWADGAAREAMIGVMAHLGADSSDARPRWPRDGGTPRLHTATFLALVRRGLVCAVRHRPRGNGWAAMTYWQISTAGKAALLARAEAARA